MAGLTQETYLPDAGQEEMARVHSFLDAHRAARGAAPMRRCLLVGSDEGDQIELPEQLYDVLVQVAAALTAGKAVSIAPQSTTLTTQQAADMLGLSRPTIVRLIDGGTLPAERIGNRRRVLLTDVVQYREDQRRRQYEALEATSLDIDEDDDPTEVIEYLRAARKSVGASRRTTSDNK